jgi:hypothetical protein
MPPKKKRKTSSRVPGLRDELGLPSENQTANDMAVFSKLAYGNTKSERLTVLKSYGYDGKWEYKNDKSTEDYAYMFNKDKNVVVIAFRGTSIGGKQTYRDLKQDAHIVLGTNKWSTRYKRTTEAVKKELEGIDKSKTSILFTGHSLGGRLASDIGQDMNLPAVVFNKGSGPVINNPLTGIMNRIRGLKYDTVHYTTNDMSKKQFDLLSGASVIFGDADKDVKYVDQKAGTGAHTIDNFVPDTVDHDPVEKDDDDILRKLVEGDDSDQNSYKIAKKLVSSLVTLENLRRVYGYIRAKYSELGAIDEITHAENAIASFEEQMGEISQQVDNFLERGAAERNIPESLWNEIHQEMADAREAMQGKPWDDVWQEDIARDPRAVPIDDVKALLEDNPEELHKLLGSKPGDDFFERELQHLDEKQQELEMKHGEDGDFAGDEVTGDEPVDPDYSGQGSEDVQREIGDPVGDDVVDDVFGDSFDDVLGNAGDAAGGAGGEIGGEVGGEIGGELAGEIAGEAAAGAGAELGAGFLMALGPLGDAFALVGIGEMYIQLTDYFHKQSMEREHEEMIATERGPNPSVGYEQSEKDAHDAFRREILPRIMKNPILSQIGTKMNSMSMEKLMHYVGIDQPLNKQKSRMSMKQWESILPVFDYIAKNPTEFGYQNVNEINLTKSGFDDVYNEGTRLSDIGSFMHKVMTSHDQYKKYQNRPVGDAGTQGGTTGQTDTVRPGYHKPEVSARINKEHDHHELAQKYAYESNTRMSERGTRARIDDIAHRSKTGSRLEDSMFFGSRNRHPHANVFVDDEHPMIHEDLNLNQQPHPLDGKDSKWYHGSGAHEVDRNFSGFGYKDPKQKSLAIHPDKMAHHMSHDKNNEKTKAHSHDASQSLQMMNPNHPGKGLKSGNNTEIHDTTPSGHVGHPATTYHPNDADHPLGGYPHHEHYNSVGADHQPTNMVEPGGTYDPMEAAGHENAGGGGGELSKMRVGDLRAMESFVHSTANHEPLSKVAHTNFMHYLGESNLFL